MSSRPRDNAPPTKDKRGTSPHTSLHQQHRRRSPSSSTTISPARSLDSTTNYLKAKESTSRLELATNYARQQGKKPATDGAHNSSTLTSRRSFEKPPPRAQSRVSPNPVYRSSSSLTGKPVNSRPAGKQYGRPVTTVKKIYVKKQDIIASSSTSTTTKEQQVIIPTAEKVQDPDTQPAIQELTTVSEGEQEIVQVEDDDEKGGDELVVKDQEPVKIEQNEASSDKDDVEIVNVEPDEPHVEEISNEKDELIDNNNNDTDQSVVDNTNEEVQDKEAEAETSSGNEAPETKEPDVQEVVVVETKEVKNEDTSSHETDQAPETKEMEVQEVVVAEEKIEAPKARSVQVVAHGKRDVALSNDVIEETASKLREQRKNKVRALAGAFETVISLQDK